MSTIGELRSDIYALLKRLEQDAERVRPISPHAANLLDVAILDLQTTIFSITDEELRQFTDALEREPPEVMTTGVRKVAPRPQPIKRQ